MVVFFGSHATSSVVSNFGFSQVEREVTHLGSYLRVEFRLCKFYAVVALPNLLVFFFFFLTTCL